MAANDIQRVAVKTSARLHMGFYDLRAPKAFGSLGMALHAPETALVLTSRDVDSDNAPVEDAEACLLYQQICNLMKIDKPPQLSISMSIPRHAGLGSGTQLTLALGAGLNAFFDLGYDIVGIARLLGRGKRSGIGLATFLHGGFIVDTGSVTREAVPSVEQQLAFPEDWRVILIRDSDHTGVHGTIEKQAFETLTPANDDLRNMVLSHMMPALERLDLLAFGAYMHDLQTYNGNYFAPIQGGQYASFDVQQVMQWLGSNGVACMGQSSWGPTGFAIVESERVAQNIMAQARQAFAGKQNIGFTICRGRNHGATIEVS